MRVVAVLLLLANLTLFAYTRLDRAGSGESVRLAEQVQPEKIRILTPQQVAALGPAKVAALADVCLEWGPFNDADRARALAELEPAGLGRLLTQKRTESTTAFWVYVPRTWNRSTIDRRLAELTAAGIDNVTLVDTGPQRYTIALGAYRTEQDANARLAEVKAKGVADAQLGPRQQTAIVTHLVVRDPSAPIVSRIRALQPNYAGTDVRIGACDKGG
jgi:hypothetical protein